MKPKHCVEGITFVLYGEHSTLNEEGNVTPVNLGEYSVSTTNGEVQINNEDELLKSIKKALQAIACTYLQK